MSGPMDDYCKHHCNIAITTCWQCDVENRDHKIASLESSLSSSRAEVERLRGELADAKKFASRTDYNNALSDISSLRSSLAEKDSEAATRESYIRALEDAPLENNEVIARLTTQLKEAQEALRPFAEMSAQIPKHWPESQPLAWDCFDHGDDRIPTVGDYRRAARVMEAKHGLR